MRWLPPLFGLAAAVAASALGASPSSVPRRRTRAGATAGYRLVGRRLHKVWSNGASGTSPVVAGGLLYVYDPGGRLNVYVPSSGRRVVSLPAGPGHWSSPIVVNGGVVLPEGSANDHVTNGVVDIYRLP